MHPAATAWQEALGRLDRWFQSVSAAHPGVIPCGPGCNACCHGPFDISVADALLLREGLMTLSDQDRAAVRSRARAQLERMRTRAPSWQAPWDLAQLGEEAFDTLMDACRNYASAGSNATQPILFEPMVLSILVSQQKQIARLQKALNATGRPAGAGS